MKQEYENLPGVFMSGIKKDFPDYIDLFNDVNVKDSDEVRSVLSPGAYFVDLMKLKDQYKTSGDHENDRIDSYRPDLYDITLDTDNTYGEIPFLDIVNEVLDRQIKTLNTGITDTKDAVKNAFYPFELPVNLKEKFISGLFTYCRTNPTDFYKTFGNDGMKKSADNITGTYLGLSKKEIEIIITPQVTDADASRLIALYGAKDLDEFNSIDEIKAFLQKTGLKRKDLDEILLQNLSHNEILAGKACSFFVNDGINDGYFLNIDELEIDIGSGVKETQVRLCKSKIVTVNNVKTVISEQIEAYSTGKLERLKYFDRINRFVRLAERLGWSFTDLDLVLNRCCNGTLDMTALNVITFVKYLADTYELGIDTVCALFGMIKDYGKGNGKTPVDFFSVLFENGYNVSILDAANAVDTAKLDKRLQSSLKISEDDFLKLKNAFGLTYSVNGNYTIDIGILSALYRMSELAGIFELSIAGILDLCEVIDINRETIDVVLKPFFPYERPIRKSVDVLKDMLSSKNAPGSVNDLIPTDVLWLVSVMEKVTSYLSDNGISVEQLLFICTEREDVECDGIPGRSDKLSFFKNAVAEFSGVTVNSDLFLSASFNQVSADTLLGLLKSADYRCISDDGIVIYVPVQTQLAGALGKIFKQNFVFTAEDFLPIETMVTETVNIDTFLNNIVTDLKNGYYLDNDGNVPESMYPLFADSDNREYLVFTDPLNNYDDSLIKAIFDIIKTRVDNYQKAVLSIPGEVSLILEKIANSLEKQDYTFLTLLQDAFGATRETVRQIAELVFKTPDESTGVMVRNFMEPLFSAYLENSGSSDLPVDPDFNSTFRRFEQYLLLVTLHGFNSDETRVFLKKQEIAKYLPEKIQFTDGFKDANGRYLIDAIYTDPSGDIHVFGNKKYAVYSGKDYGVIKTGDITSLGFSTDRIDAAFTAVTGDTIGGQKVLTYNTYLFFGKNFIVINYILQNNSYIVKDIDPAKPVKGNFGLVKNNIQDPASANNVDAAMTYDNDLYLFKGNQYVKYSDYSKDSVFTDEGYPKNIAANWDGEITDKDGNPLAALPSSFKNNIDAMTSVIEKKTVGGVQQNVETNYAFVNNKFVRLDSIAGLPRRVNDIWGKVFNNFQSDVADQRGIDAAFVYNDGTRDITYIFCGSQYARYSGNLNPDIDVNNFHVDEGYPKLIRNNWENENVFDGSGKAVKFPDAFKDGINAAFRAPDGSIYAFCGAQYEKLQENPAAPSDNKSFWGNVLNNIAQSGIVDAAVFYGGKLYLFSNNQYARYSGAVNVNDPGFYCDEGYPKLIGSPTCEPEETAWQSLSTLFKAKVTSALSGTDNAFYLFANDKFAKISGTVVTESDIPGRWGIVRNELQTANKVDATLLDKNNNLYLFSNDQFYRYSNYKYQTAKFYADEGYPKSLVRFKEENGGQSGNIDALGNKLSAAFKAPDGTNYFFSGNNFVSSVNNAAQSIKDVWGKSNNSLITNNHVDSAFTDPNGSIYVFSDTQYYKYSNSKNPDSGDFYVDDGYPRSIAGDFKNLSKIDISFVIKVTVDGTESYKLYLFNIQNKKFIRCSFDANNNITADFDQKNIDQSVTNVPIEKIILSRITTDLNSNYVSTIFYESAASRKRLYFLFTYNKIKQHLAFIDMNTNIWVDMSDDADNNFFPQVGFVDAIYSDGNSTFHAFGDANYAQFVFIPEIFYQKTGNVKKSINAIWGKAPNKFQSLNEVNGAFLFEDASSFRTYLFCADQYVKYTMQKGSSYVYGFIDTGYPKKIKDGWTGENTGIALPETFAAQGMDLFQDNGTVKTVHFFNNSNYNNSQAGTPVPTKSVWGFVKNNFQREAVTDVIRIDASCVLTNTNGIKQTYLFSKDQYIRYTGNYDGYADEGYPKTIRNNWGNESMGYAIPETFKNDGYAIVEDSSAKKVYVFKDMTFNISDSGSAEFDVKSLWGRVRNNIVSTGTVDAAFSVKPSADTFTYVFSGDQYYRYLWKTTDPFKYVDEGYPKKISNWNATEKFGGQNLLLMPAVFYNGINSVFAQNNVIYATSVYKDGNNVMRNDFVRSNDSANSLFSVKAYWGKVVNFIDQKNKVDSGFMYGGSLYLFCNTQYVRYSYVLPENLAGTFYVDEGYPKTIADKFPGEIKSGLSSPDIKNVDAICSSGDEVYLFSGNYYWQIDKTGFVKTKQLITSTWGRVYNVFDNDIGVSAAFAGGDGRYYLFSGNQCIRYTGGIVPGSGYVDEGYPKIISHVFAGLPAGYTENIDAAFGFENRTYFFYADGNYIRYSDPFYRKIDGYFPMSISDKWKYSPEFTISEVCSYEKFKELTSAYNRKDKTILKYFDDGLDDSAKLSDITGWDPASITEFADNDYGSVESLYALRGLFAYALKLGSTPATVKNNLWDILWNDAKRNEDKAYDFLYSLVRAKYSAGEWKGMSQDFHNMTNRMTRDAYVPFLMELFKSKTGISMENTRDLYKNLLIDVEMGDSVTTSRVVEALSCVQTYFFRSIMNLEDLSDTQKTEVLGDAKKWWDWMKNYRVWEANRLVFLYPENYVRPELRTDKSPAFKKLEEALLQNDITQENVELAFKRYLEEFTTVSRLVIAGGYVYRKNDIDNNQYIVIFGHTRTEPFTYYYMTGDILNDGSGITIDWAPWIEFGIPINSNKVYPVYAFNRLFVFWAEAREKNDTEFSMAGSTKNANILYQPIINYSFFNLNKEWINPQTLMDFAPIFAEGKYADQNNLFYNIDGKNAILNAELNITNPEAVSDYSPNEFIFMGYEVSRVINNQNVSYKMRGMLTSDLEFNLVSLGGNFQAGQYSETKFDNKNFASFESLLNKNAEFPSFLGIQPSSYIQLKTGNLGDVSTQWYSFNAKGGSFLCVPDVPVFNKSPLPIAEAFEKEFTFVDAAFRGNDNIDYLFSGDRYIDSGDKFKTKKNITDDFSFRENLLADSKLELACRFGDDTIILVSDNVSKDYYYIVYYGTGYDYCANMNTVTGGTDFDIKTQNKDNSRFRFFNENTEYVRKSAAVAMKSIVQTISNAFVFKDEIYLFDDTGSFYEVDKNGISILVGTTADNQIRELDDLLPAVGGNRVMPDAVFVEKNNDGTLKNLHITKGGSYVWYDYAKNSWNTGTIESHWNGVNSITNGIFGFDNKLYVFSGDNYFNGTESVPFTDVWGKIKNSPVIENFTPVSGFAVNGKTYVFGTNGGNYFYVTYTGDNVFPDSIIPAGIDPNGENNFIISLLNTKYNATCDLEDWNVFQGIFPFDIVDAVKCKDHFILKGTVTYTRSRIENVTLDNGLIFAIPRVVNYTESLNRYCIVTQAQLKTFFKNFPGISFNNADISAIVVSKNGSGNTDKVFIFWDDNTLICEKDQSTGKNKFAQVNNGTYWNEDISKTGFAFWGFDNKIHIFADDGRYANPYNDCRLENANKKWCKIDFFAGGIDAALTLGDMVYMFVNDRFVTFKGDYKTSTLAYPERIKEKFTIDRVDAAYGFIDENLVQKFCLFSASSYAIYLQTNTGFTFTKSDYPRRIRGNWGRLAGVFNERIDAALSTTVDNKETLYLFSGSQYTEYDRRDEFPYEIDTIDYKIIRLTSNTAQKLNQRLFAGGIDALLDLSTQKEDELPGFKAAGEAIGNDDIVFSANYVDEYPVSEALDFKSTNGQYYWEIFYHAPVLIAETLNNAQKFKEAKIWYEYIFDPTEYQIPAIPDNSDKELNDNLSLIIDKILTTDEKAKVTATFMPLYWKFLPFLPYDALSYSIELYNGWETINAGLSADLQNIIKTSIQILVDILKTYLLDTPSWANLDPLMILLANEADNISVNLLGSFPESVRPRITALTDETDRMVKEYRNPYQNEAQIAKYKDDPFDPNAIAALRPLAYKKAVVMNYIDNLLDWGDMLFRQYTRETINEAMTLYVLAYDLLGRKPDNYGISKLLPVPSYRTISPWDENIPVTNALIELENAPQNAGLSSGTSTPNDSIVNDYFYIPENELFVEYWDRVEDRLMKIRNSLNIDGIKQVLALFQPPIDPMALVKSFAAGGDAGQALSDFNVAVPHYRFNFMLAKAKELSGRLNQLGGALLGALEKKDGETLSLLRNTQEHEIQNMNLTIKEAQIKDREQTIMSLKTSQASAKNRYNHYNGLINTGLSSKEIAQLVNLNVGQVFSVISQVFSTISSICYAVPNAGSPFAMTYGGQQLGHVIQGLEGGFRTASEISNFAANLNSILAGYERRSQDWTLQRDTADYDIQQIGYQITGANIQMDIAKQEQDILKKQIKQNEAIDTFMNNKFTNGDLYQWMTGKLSGVFFRTYQMAYDFAKAAEKAFQFELGMKETDVSFISPVYWDSLKKGLLSGEQLQFDLDRMEKAYYEKNTRRFEISKTISLLLHDPFALLDLRNKRTCEFSFDERLFDLDFPGHYCRQIKSISLTFPSITGPYQNFNATLTQMSHRTLISPDVTGMTFMMAPSTDANQPLSVRSDWRANQQIALSRGVNDSGMFQVNFQDERYLPFEGTGAVSTWKLELGGYNGVIDLSTLSDVIIKVEYTALNGGEAFGNKVKKALGRIDAAKVINIAQEFSDEWNKFMINPASNAGLSFAIPVEMLQNMTKDPVMAAYMLYDLTDAGKKTALNDTAMMINGKSVKNASLMNAEDQPTLPVSHGSVNVVMTPDNADLFTPENVRNIGLVITYKTKFTF
jgi:hypothetical protein